MWSAVPVLFAVPNYSANVAEEKPKASRVFRQQPVMKSDWIGGSGEAVWSHETSRPVRQGEIPQQ